MSISSPIAPSPIASGTLKIAFVLEYSLGHVTHAQNLKRMLERDGSVSPTFIELDFHDSSFPGGNLPLVRSNWSVRASLRAYLALRSQVESLDAALFHTQVTSLFSAGVMRRVPSVVSLDATPLQYDDLGAAYGHRPSGVGFIESLKKRLNERAFSKARKLVTWSEWAKNSLVSDYNVPASKIVVIPPGIDTRQQWRFAPRQSNRGSVRMLFVGGDFERKGGKALLAAMRDERLMRLNLHLDIVTKSDSYVEEVPCVSVHRGLTPNSDELRSLFAQADVFVFPTQADCLPLAVMEALAAGLPVITTAVGALPEAVTHQETGLIVPPDDAKALADAILKLATDAKLRTQMSVRARQVAEERFDAETNYRRLVELVKAVQA